MSILDAVLKTAEATPPVDNKLSRFGNPAFKTFYDLVAEVCWWLFTGRHRAD